MGLASLRRWGNLVGTKVPCCLVNSSVLAKHNVWSRRERSTRLYREGNLYHMCELAMSHRSLHQWNRQRRVGPGWKLTMENATSRRNVRINLKNSRECWKLISPQRWRGRSIVKRIMPCSQRGARCVRKRKEQEHSRGDRRTRNWQSKNNTDRESTQISSTCARKELRRQCLR